LGGSAGAPGNIESGRPSRTALGAAVHRAVHQVLEGGRIFADLLALRILGWDAKAARREAESGGDRRLLRLFIAVRSRFAEDAFAAAHAGGVRQLVVLGAGLDTYAYRTTLREGLRVFELDHPATQEWKRGLLAAAGITTPPSLTFVPIDFERVTPERGLAGAGFDAARPAFFIWLGVVPYLSEAGVLATLAWIGGLPGGTQVVFDYANPTDEGAGKSELRAAHRALAARVAAVGEPFRTYFETDLLHARLRSLGYRHLEDLGPAAIGERYFGIRTGAREAGGHVLRATT